MEGLRRDGGHLGELRRHQHRRNLRTMSEIPSSTRRGTVTDQAGHGRSCERFARMKGSGEQVSGIAFKGRCGRCFGLCGRCKVQAKCVRGLTVGRRGATAVQRGRKAELEGGAGGRRWRAACAVCVQEEARRTSKRHRFQRQDAARLRGGAAGSTAVRALQRSSRGWFEGRGLSTTAS